MSPKKKARLAAERHFHLARAAEIEEKLAAVIPQIDLSQFNPAWKRGIRLSKEGRAAVLAAYDRGMKQVDVGALFHISEAAANFWHQRWQTGSHDEARR